MIPISLDALPLAYVAICAGVIALAWIAGAVNSRRRLRRNLTSIVQCAICGTSFEKPKDAEFPKCPCCGHANEARPARYF